jgi:predicted permease
VIRFPPFLAIIAAFVVAALGEWPAMVQDALERIATTLVPVALVSVGTQVRFGLGPLRAEGRGLVFGLGYKMALAPVMIFLFAVIFGISDPTREIAVLEAGMAPMITATVLAMEAGLAQSLGALMLGIGIPLSLVTVPLIHLAFRH